MTHFQTYQEKTKNNNISKSEMIDGRNYRIESETEFDILSWDDFRIDVIDRCGCDGKVHTLNIFNKNTDEIIKMIKSI